MTEEFADAASPDNGEERDLSDIGLADISTGEVDVATPLALAPNFPAMVASAPSAPGVPLVSEVRANLGTGLTLALRFVQARFLSIWGLLLAAALCPPQVFTDFAVFSTLANFISVATLLRFEAVFFQNSDPLRLGQAFRLALAAGAVFLSVVTLVTLLVMAEGWVLPEVAALFMVSLTSRALIRLIMAEATAEGDFGAVGNINIVQALVQPGMMILLIWSFGPAALALFAADAVGHTVSACYLAWRRRGALARLTLSQEWSRRELRYSAARWAKAPRILLPSALLSFGFMAAPLVALPLAGDPMLAAHLALAMRLLEMPTQLFATVSVPLVMNTLRRTVHQDRQHATRVITLCLAAAAAGLFATIALISVGADFLLTGTQWQGIGKIVTVLALFYGGSALVVPLHEIATLSHHPHRQLATNAVALALVGLIVLWFGTLSLALLCAVGFVSLARMLAHVRFAWTRLEPERFAAPVSSTG